VGSRSRTQGGLILFTLFVLSAFFFPVSFAASSAADTEPIHLALNYLKASQKDDGGFGDGGITEWVMMAVSAAGQDPRGWYRNGNIPMDYLGSLPLTHNPYDWIRMTLTLAAVGEDAKNFNGIDYLEKIKGHYKDGQFGDPSSLRDDYWALLALVAGGEERSREARNSGQFILNHQNPDGSWSASTTGIETCADNTAVAMVALSAAGLPPDSEVFAKGIRYLKKVQGKDGGFSYLFMPANAASDAWVLQALSAAGKDPSNFKTGAKNVLGHLLSLQQSDGSFKWNADVANSPLMMTAYAVPALLGKPYPIRPATSAFVTLGLRVEGEAETLLETCVTLGPATFRDVTGKAHSTPFPTPLSALAEALKKNCTDLAIENSGMGVYLKRVAGESGGWQYRVNDRIPMAPAQEYRLKSGDEVIWFYDYHGVKSPLRVVPEKTSAWEGEEISFRLEQFDDAADRWKPGQDTCLLLGGERYPAPGAMATVKFSQQGTYTCYADKKDAIRSVKKCVTVHAERTMKVHIRVEDNGGLLCDEDVSFSGFTARDINGRAIDIKRPVLVGALEAARRRNLLDYRIIQTSEGIILVSINGLEEDNNHGSWWFEVNGKRVLEDIDEFPIEDGDHVCFFRGKDPKPQCVIH